MNEQKKLSVYQIDIVFEAADFKSASEIENALQKRFPNKSRILKLEEVTLKRPL